MQTLPFAQAAVTSSFLIANILGLIGVVLAIFGLQAVYFVVKGTAGERWALSGMVFSTAGVSFFLPFLGIFTFAAPIVERMYLSGQGDSVDVIAGPSAHPIFPPWSLAACPYCSSSWARYF